MNPDETMEQNWMIAQEFIANDELVCFESFDVKNGIMEYSALYYVGHGPNRTAYNVVIKTPVNKIDKWVKYIGSNDLVKIGGKIEVESIKTF